MMNNTYSMVINQSERAWSFQWARTLIALERSLPLDELAAYQREYSINMAAKQAEGNAPSDDAVSGASNCDHSDNNEKNNNNNNNNIIVPATKIDNFVPGLMIIKRMGFTKAERKRLVLGYWKVCYQ